MSGPAGYGPPHSALPPTTPRTASIAVLVAGCLIGVALKLGGSVYVENVGSAVDDTLDSVTRINLLFTAGDTIPLIALGVFAALQSVGVTRRAFGVLAMVAVAGLLAAVIMSASTLGIEDPVLYSTVVATIATTAAATTWILVRRRSLVTLLVAPIAVVGGFLFHWGTITWLVNNRQLTYVAAQAISELLLFLSVVLLAWLAVGVDAVAAPKRGVSTVPPDSNMPIGYTADGQPVFEYRPSQQ